VLFNWISNMRTYYMYMKIWRTGCLCSINFFLLTYYLLFYCFMSDTFQEGTRWYVGCHSVSPLYSPVYWSNLPPTSAIRNKTQVLAIKYWPLVESIVLAISMNTAAGHWGHCQQHHRKGSVWCMLGYLD